MRTLLLISAFLLSWLSPNKAQLALSYSRMEIGQSSWNQLAESLNEPQPFNAFNGLNLGFWFRLKSYRWEFLPELQYESMLKTSKPEYSYEVSTYSFRLHNRIYLFDFFNDCNCPTFSKQNTFFKRGFFLEFSPGLSLPKLQYTDETGNIKRKMLPVLQLSIGTGLDIGLSDSFTLTPLLRYRYLHRIPISEQPAKLRPYSLHPEVTPETTDSWGGLELGLQLLWRYKK